MQALLRTLRLQYAMRRDLIHISAIGAFYFSADHMIVTRMLNQLRTVGLLHNPKMDGHFIR